jgi:hypothetical protein
MSANVGSNTPLPVADSQGNPVPVELAFDRLLLPSSVTRQSIYIFQDGASQVTITPSIAYDPVARVVTVTPLTQLAMGQTYTVQIVTPKLITDPSGLHAIDGALMDPTQPTSVTFTVGPAATTALASAPAIDFCTDIGPSLSPTGCTTNGCHAASYPAEGLVLGGLMMPTLGIQSTAIGHAAHEVSTGPLSTPQPPSVQFPDNMPIIDPGTGTVGDPANSYLLYKVLMAIPASGASTVQPYSVSWNPLSDQERAALAAMIPGREMPFPSPKGLSGVGPSTSSLTIDQMENLSLWIAQGANLPGSCP